MILAAGISARTAPLSTIAMLLKAARGEWIKFLHDDDVLKPNCLQVLAAIVREYRHAIAVSCACEHFLDGKLVGGFDGRDRAVLEQIEPGDALLAMYILDEAGWALPSQQMVHRTVAEGGVLFEKALESILCTTAGSMPGCAPRYNIGL